MPGRTRGSGASRSTLSSCLPRTRGAGWQPAPASGRPPASCASGPSARVVDVEVQSLVAEQGVGVVKLEQVDALAGVVVAAGLHVSVAVPPVHRHDLPIATSKGAPGASLHIANGDRVCVSKMARCLGVTSETE